MSEADRQAGKQESGGNELEGNTLLNSENQEIDEKTDKKSRVSVKYECMASSCLTFDQSVGRSTTGKTFLRRTGR